MFTSKITFSGFTKGLYPVANIQQLSGYYVIDLLFPESFNEKLAKKKKYGEQLCLGVDGIPASVVDVKKVDYNLVVQIKIPEETYVSSTLKSLKINDKVSVSVQSTKEKKYLVSSQPVGKARLIAFGMAPGHQHTQELIFETPADLAQTIQNSKWKGVGKDGADQVGVGLNGSAFFVQQHEQTAEKVKFRIHIGELTRRTSVFGSEEMQVGQEFNLSPVPSLEFSLK